MAKYILAIALLVFLVLENNSIFKRLHVESLPSSKSDSSIHTRHSHQHNDKNEEEQRNINSPYSSSHHSRHKRKHHSHQHQNQNSNLRPSLETNQQQLNTDSSIENDDLLAAHLLRHRLHQMEHLLQHREHYQRRTRSSSTLDLKLPNLKSMPRPWQHLSEVDDEDMFADEPNTSEHVSESDDVAASSQRFEIPTSLGAFEDEGFSEEFPMSGIPPDTDVTDASRYQYSNERVVESNEEAMKATLSSESADHTAAGHRCPKCEVERQVEHITEEELTRLRIEFVKAQILEKLRLKERPKVSAVALPKPIQEGVTIDNGDENTKNKEDDYYARTSKKFIFLQRETRECENTGSKTSICFSFKIDDADADGFDVNTAVLWLFKNKTKSKLSTSSIPVNSSSTLKDQETIVVSEVQQPVDSKFRPIVKTIAIQTTDVQDKWLEIDIEWPIKRWFGNHDLSHLIQISCESCEEMISIDKDYRPFIMIDTQNRRRTARQKRGINCTDGVTECCREKLYISFDEIGWGDWIIQPRGYDAYFCRGSCSTVASVTQSSSHHSTFLQKVIAMNRGKGRKPLELIPCCTAKQYSSLQLVFMDTNNTATQKTFPNMVIESCGCR